MLPVELPHSELEQRCNSAMQLLRPELLHLWPGFGGSSNDCVNMFWPTPGVDCCVPTDLRANWKTQMDPQSIPQGRTQDFGYLPLKDSSTPSPLMACERARKALCHKCHSLIGSESHATRCRKNTRASQLLSVRDPWATIAFQENLPHYCNVWFCVAKSATERMCFDCFSTSEW